jgi:hypothetical protein
MPRVVPVLWPWVLHSIKREQVVPGTDNCIAWPWARQSSLQWIIFEMTDQQLEGGAPLVPFLSG